MNQNYMLKTHISFPLMVTNECFLIHDSVCACFKNQDKFPLGTNLYALVDVDIRLKYLPAVCCSWLDETKEFGHNNKKSFLKIFNPRSLF